MANVKTRILIGLFQLLVALFFSIITIKTLFLRLGYEIEVVLILIAIFMGLTGFLNVHNGD